MCVSFVSRVGDVQCGQHSIAVYVVHKICAPIPAVVAAQGTVYAWVCAVYNGCETHADCTHTHIDTHLRQCVCPINSIVWLHLITAVGSCWSWAAHLTTPEYASRRGQAANPSPEANPASARCQCHKGPKRQGARPCLPNACRAPPLVVLSEDRVLRSSSKTWKAGTLATGCTQQLIASSLLAVWPRHLCPQRPQTKSVRQSLNALPGAKRTSS